MYICSLKHFTNSLFVLAFDSVVKGIIYDRIDAHMKDLVNLKFSTQWLSSPVLLSLNLIYFHFAW